MYVLTPEQCLSQTRIRLAEGNHIGRAIGTILHRLWMSTG